MAEPARRPALTAGMLHPVQPLKNGRYSGLFPPSLPSRLERDGSSQWRFNKNMTTAIMEFTAAALRRIHTCFPFSLPPSQVFRRRRACGGKPFCGAKVRKKSQNPPGGRETLAEYVRARGLPAVRRAGEKKQGGLKMKQGPTLSEQGAVLLFRETVLFFREPFGAVSLG